jgi:hypothetical protein
MGVAMDTPPLPPSLFDGLDDHVLIVIDLSHISSDLVHDLTSFLS